MDWRSIVLDVADQFISVHLEYCGVVTVIIRGHDSVVLANMLNIYTCRQGRRKGGGMNITTSAVGAAGDYGSFGHFAIVISEDKDSGWAIYCRRIWIW